MNKAKLKSYAPQARVDFIAAVTARANLLGLSEKAGQLEVAPVQTQGDVALIAGQAWPAKVATQREQLIARMRREGFAQTCEAIAYTWFNRFAALRYMELHDYLGHGHRALSSAEGGLPDILTYASDLAHAGDTGLPGLKAELITEMKLTGNRDGELYRMLLVAQCNALSSAMPFLFERIDDDSELLLPDNLLRSDSVIAKLVEEIPEEDWAEVEIIGWLYQFYISDKKDQVIGKVVKSEDIPAATQLFTPNWIVQYLVQNSVGRLWLMANPQSTLAKDWPYYIKPAEQMPEVQNQLDALVQIRVREDGDTLNPESITVLDPACGSGHILVVAYDVLKSIYLERGYQPRAIPRLILEKNLYGLDIDDRAAQMAGFALMMKARADDRRLFSDPVNLNILSLQESNSLDEKNLTQSLEALADSIQLKSDLGALGSGFVAQDLFPESHTQGSLGEATPKSLQNKELTSDIAALIATFADAKTFGSLITVPMHLSMKLVWLKELIHLAYQKGDMYAKSAAQDLMPLVDQAKILAMQFDAVLVNPPYLSTKGYSDLLSDFVVQNYPEGKRDLFSAFTFRAASMLKNGGSSSLVTPMVWMFIQSYEEMRRFLIRDKGITSLVRLEYNSFEPACVPVCIFSFSNNVPKNLKSTFIDLSEFKGHELQSPKILEAINSNLCHWKYDRFLSDLAKLPDGILAFWLPARMIEAMGRGQQLSLFATGRKGMYTGQNARFVRFWWEVSAKKLSIMNEIDPKWFPYANGGGYRKWFGFIEHVVNWKGNGAELRSFTDSDGKARAGAFNLDYIFKEGVFWTAISNYDFCARLLPEGSLFSSAANAMYGKNIDALVLLSLLNSRISTLALKAINPTLNYNAGDVEKVPAIGISDSFQNAVRKIANAAVNIARKDWNMYENAVEFLQLPLVGLRSDCRLLSESHELFRSESDLRFETLHQLEVDNNVACINEFNLTGEISPEVPQEQIILFRADREKDCQRLISYAIGCIVGRYSLDKPGLIYADGGNINFDSTLYKTFPADRGGIVPITEELWFEDDAANRIKEFLAAVWGSDTVDQNMRWLAESLGAKLGETSDETIRRYVADKFFKDHLQTYKKRPIYWLFSSGKQGAFQALVYLHRYNEGTLARMRAEYVAPLTSKIQSRIEMLEKDVSAASSTAARNKLTKEVEKLKKKHVELLAYDEQLRHYADMRITLDLDDGVKVNYGKFGDLLAEVKAVTGGAADE